MVGVRSFLASTGSNALNRPSVSTGDINRGLAAINAGLQKIAEKGPTEFKQDRRSATLYAPTQVVCSVDGNGQVTMTTGRADWMVGCSIQISGDPYQNEIVGFSGDDVSLLRTHPGGAGTGVSATVYCDAVLLASDVGAVLEPVELPPNRRLSSAQSRADFDRFTYQNNTSSSAATSITKSVGTPVIYWVEPYYSVVEDYLPLYIRVNPMPNTLMSIVMRVEHKPERVDEDIYSSDDEDPNYQFTSVPADKVETVLLPLARYYFSAHPSFKNREARAVIVEHYREAMDAITVGGTNFAPSRKQNVARYK